MDGFEGPLFSIVCHTGCTAPPAAAAPRGRLPPSLLPTKPMLLLNGAHDKRGCTQPPQPPDARPASRRVACVCACSASVGGQCHMNPPLITPPGHKATAGQPGRVRRFCPYRPTGAPCVPEERALATLRRWLFGAGRALRRAPWMLLAAARSLHDEGLLLESLIDGSMVRARRPAPAPPRQSGSSRQPQTMISGPSLAGSVDGGRWGP